MDELTALEQWYRRQCDGDWEHSYGISIQTLDNPGWRVRIDVADTYLADRAFERVEVERTSDDWCRCWVEAGTFQAACGPGNLREALSVFQKWSSADI